MNSIQESTNELNAAIRYAENAIASANQTIESMQFRQDMAMKQYTEQTGREQALEREVANLKECLKIETAALERLREDTPTMPVIPKDVAIAIFREGIKQGVYDACDEIDNSDSVEIEESGYTEGFEVSFSKYVDLTEHINTDWMRGKVGSYEELNVVNALMGLCETKGFECRIHGIDEKKTPKIQ